MFTSDISVSDFGLNNNERDHVRELNSLLRGEISAAETYRMAIEKISAGSEAAALGNVGLLTSIQEDHERAAHTLRDRIAELGGEPSDSSGAWGAWAASVQGTMNLFGDSSALKSLKEGEEHGLKDYEAAVDEMDATSAQLVHNQLIPSQQKHISILNQLISGVGHA
jgi:bacterioferritin (cytochrome b1)